MSGSRPRNASPRAHSAALGYALSDHLPSDPLVAYFDSVFDPGCHTISSPDLLHSGPGLMSPHQDRHLAPILLSAGLPCVLYTQLGSRKCQITVLLVKIICYCQTSTLVRPRATLAHVGSACLQPQTCMLLISASLL